jgi:hypothetical protein
MIGLSTRNGFTSVEIQIYFRVMRTRLCACNMQRANSHPDKNTAIIRANFLNPLRRNLETGQGYLPCTLFHFTLVNIILSLFRSFFFNLCGGTLGTAATTGLLYQSQMISDGDCGEIGGMKIGRGNRSTRRKPAPAPLCPTQIPHD